jgi:hypothetical protein
MIGPQIAAARGWSVRNRCCQKVSTAQRWARFVHQIQHERPAWRGTGACVRGMTRWAGLGGVTAARAGARAATTAAGGVALPRLGGLVSPSSRQRTATDFGAVLSPFCSGRGDRVVGVCDDLTLGCRGFDSGGASAMSEVPATMAVWNAVIVVPRWAGRDDQDQRLADRLVRPVSQARPGGGVPRGDLSMRVAGLRSRHRKPCQS